MSALIHTISATAREPRGFNPSVPPTERFALRYTPARYSNQYFPLYISGQYGRSTDREIWGLFRNEPDDNPSFSHYYRLTIAEWNALLNERNRFEFGANSTLFVYEPDARVQLFHLLDGEALNSYPSLQAQCDMNEKTGRVLDTLIHNATFPSGYDKSDLRAVMTDRDFDERDLYTQCGIARLVYTFVKHAPSDEIVEFNAIHQTEDARIRSGQGHARFTDIVAIAHEFMETLFPTITDANDARVGRRGLHADREHTHRSAKEIMDAFFEPVAARMIADPSRLAALMTYAQFDAAYINPPPADGAE